MAVSQELFRVELLSSELNWICEGCFPMSFLIVIVD